MKNSLIITQLHMMKAQIKSYTNIE